MYYFFCVWIFIFIVMSVIYISLEIETTLTGSSSSVIENSSFTLTCVGDFHRVIWYRNSIRIDRGYCDEPPDVDYRYRLLEGSCSERDYEYTFEVTLSEVNRKQHGDVWKCESIYTSNDIVLKVEVPVSTVKIEAKDLIGSTLTIIENETTTLTCTTSYCRPMANITWLIKDKLYNSRTIDGSNSTFISDDKDTSISHTESIIQVVFDATVNGETLICMADNIPNYKNVVHNVVLDIVYPPRINRKADIQYGKNITISYTAIAKPLPTFTWHKHGISIPRYHPRITISTFNLQTNLTIINVETNDYGEYTLVVTNNYGSILEIFHLKQTDNMSQTSESTNSVIGASVGGTVGVVVLISALLVVFILRRRHLRTLSEQERQEGSPSIQIVSDKVVYENMKLNAIQDGDEIVTVDANKITTTEGLNEYEDLRLSGSNKMKG